MEKLPVADYSLIRSEDENTSTKLETNSHTHPCFEESQQQNTEQKVKKHCISFPINAKVHCVRSSKADDSGSTRKRYSIWEDEGSEAGDEKEGKNDKEQNSLKTSSTNKGKSNECSKSNRTSKFTNESRSSSSTNKDNSHDCSKTDSSKCSKSNRTSKFTNESRSSSSTNKDNSRNCSKTDSSKCSKSDRTCKFTNERRSSSSTNKDNSHNSSKTDRTSKFASEKKCEDKTRQGKNDKTDEQQKRHSLGKKDKMSISRDKERSRRNGRGDSKSSLTKSGTCEKKSVSDKKTHVTVKDMNKNKTQLVEDKGKKQTKSHHKKGKSSYISQLSKKGLKKFDCRSSWKSFKKIFFVCDARYCVEESVLKEYCNIPIQVLTKPNLKIDDIPNLLMSKIDAPNSCPNSLFICSVGTSDLIELQNIPSCQDLDHEPAKYICLKKVDGKGLAKEVILKSRKIKTELQKLLGPTTEVYFTSILPLSFQIYRDREIKKHNLVTEHELDLKIFKNDISKWEERLYEAMHSFNTYHAKNYPLHLSLQLATHAQCLGRELTNFYKVCTVDGLNLTRDICKDISVGIGKTLYKFCTWRGRYEKVIIVGDSRLEHIRKAWPGDMKYNCKFVTHPQLKLKDFKCKDELIIKELSSAKNSLIVIGVGMNDFSQLSSHSSCMCKARLKILIPRNHRHQRSIKFILAEARSYMKRAVSTLNKVTVNCDTVFMPFYGIDLIAHEDYRLRNHTSCDAYRRLLGYNAVSKNLLAMDILNEACYKYSKLNFLPIWDLFPLYPKAFVNNKYKKISSSILYDGIHPSPDIALKQAKMVYWKVNEALSIENVSDTKQKVPRSTFPISEITIIKECDLLRHHPESSVCYPEWSNEPTGDQHLYSFKEEDIQK
ncbi:hypothetical protein SK128_005421 [Halocaridina rubra]|uniref:Uncharacterized protein n=1 Tax=Halocaridina rubra TaxID=373956 RepID=A0AAN8X1E9_HALRR